jgi:hypothetical protein
MATGGAVKIASLLLAVALSALASRAAAQADVAACVADHKLVQTARESGHFLEGRDAAGRCAQASCPQLIRQDCAAWYVDLADSTPSIVLDVHDRAGHDIAEPSVTLDERALDMHGRAVSLDPGTHALHVTAAGFAAHSERIMLRQGEKNRRISIELQPLSVSAPVEPLAPRRFEPVVITLGVIGVAGLATFAGLGLAGKLQNNDLDDCKPGCASGDVDRVNHMYLGANIAAALGGSAAVAATVLYVLDRKRERRVNVAVNPLGMSLRGAF